MTCGYRPGQNSTRADTIFFNWTGSANISLKRKILVKRHAMVPVGGFTNILAQSLSILVVEDDPGDFGLVNAYLRKAGLWHGASTSKVVWAKTLSEGLAMASEQRPGLVLLDLSLPDSLGIPTVKAISAVCPGTPIVVLTGRDDNDQAIAALEVGAQDYLIKGQFDQHTLGRAIRHALVRGKLESRLRLFEAALDRAANGIVISDINGNIEWTNKAFTHLTGFSAEEAFGQNPRVLIKSGRQDQAFYQQMWATILAGKEWRGELVNRRKDGVLYDESLSIASVIGGDGGIEHFVAIKQDISERKQAELQLRLSEQRLALALAASGLGFWDWHIPSGEVVFNERWCAMLGYRMEEIEPDVRSWELLVHPEDWPTIRATLDAHLKGETPVYESEHRLRHKEGHWVWVLDQGKVVERDAAGNPLRAAGTHLDISNHKRLNLEGTHLLRRIESLIRDASKPPARIEAEGSERLAESAQPGRLSKRQSQVLELVATGCTSAQIAERLDITPATVITHRRDLMRRLDLHSIAELTRYAIEHKLGSV
jgi:PAS domain S-box-containing protein